MYPYYSTSETEKYTSLIFFIRQILSVSDNGAVLIYEDMVDCIHHWDLGTSHKGIVHAKCRKCGEEKDFDNTPSFKSGTFGSKKKVTEPIIIPASDKLD